MPTTTWQIANGEIQRPLGFESFSTTENIAVGDKVVSTELSDRWDQDRRFNGWFCMIRGTANDEVVRRVTASKGSTAPEGELTLAGAALALESAAVTCEVSFFHPDDVKRAYNRARLIVFDHLAAHKDHRGVITDRDTLVYPVPTAIRQVDRIYLGRALLASHPQNLFTDGGFENWTTATNPTDWTFAGTGSVNQEVQTNALVNHMVLTGSNSARLAVTAASTLLETLTPDVGIEGANIVMAAYVYCRTASAIRLQIDSDADTANNGSFHGGTGWEWLSHTFTISDTATNVIGGFQINAASAAYLDRALIWAGPPSAPEGEWDIQTDAEWIPSLDGASDGGQIFLRTRPRDEEILRIIGRGFLSSVSVDSDTFEIDGELLEPLYNKVRAMLSWERTGGDPDSPWADRAREYDAAYLDGINRPIIEKARPQLRAHHNVFS
jgi:hypothetical protein